MIYSEEALLLLRKKVARYMGDRRYAHTLGVERAVMDIGRILMNGCLGELRAAALLHDVAKECSREELCSLMEAGGIKLSKEDMETSSAWHSFAAPVLVARDFTEYALPGILKSIEHHTLGAPDMSTFDKVIFISDYVEDGRGYQSCVKVRDFIYSNLSNKNDHEENIAILNKAMLMSIDFTIESLNERGLVVNSRTILTKRALLDSICL